MTRGRFITLEGGEGAGKSTQARLLADALRAQGLTVHVTREPGGSPGAEDIRALLVSGAVDRWDPVAETLLHYAARRDHVARLITPALARGEWIVSDRFADSTMAYQAYAQGVEIERVRAIHKAALDDFQPDLTLVLDLPVAEGFARAASRGDGASRYDAMGEAAHERIRQAFLHIAAEAPARCAVIDAARTIDAVQADIRAAVAARLGLAVA